MTKQVQQLLDEANENSARVRAMFDVQSEESLKRRPPSGGWSAVECIEHLALTTGLYERLVPSAVNDAQRRGARGEGPFTMDFKGRLLKWVLEPPYRMRVKTYHLVDVNEVHEPKKVLGEFLASQERLRAMLASADGLALDAILVASPFNKKITYNLYSAFANILAHQRRHLWQAEQALRPRIALG
jgi:hypothetical protein